MTLRSRKKPPITAPSHITKATDADSSSLTVPRGFHQAYASGRCVLAIAAGFAMLLSCLDAPAHAGESTKWTPHRPTKSLATASVPRIVVTPNQAKPSNRVATRTHQTANAVSPSNAPGQLHWKSASRLENTSTHLKWGSGRSEAPIGTRSLSEARTDMQRQIPAAPTQVAPTQAAPTQATHLKSASTRSKPVSFSKAAAPPKTLDECKADSTPLEVARVHEMPRLLARPDAEPIRGMKQTQKLYSVKVASHNEAETAQGQPSAERTPANQKPVQRAVSVLSLMPQPDPQLTENAEPTSVLVPMPSKRQGTPELAPQPAPRTADAATTAEPLRQVQHLENLQLPLRDLTDSDLHPVERVAQRGGPAAPSPDDLFVDPNSLRNRKTDPLQFKDTTPIGGAQTQTQATQLRSRFDGVGVDSLDPPVNEEAEAPLFQLPTVDQTTPEPSEPTFSLPESSPPSAASESVIEFGDQESSEPRSFQAEAIPSASAEPETTGDIESSVNKQLNQIDALPPVPANSNGESLPVPGQNPLAIFGEEPIDQNREQPPAELAVTNGRDCSGEGCREDMQLLRRREQTNMSLNITPSIEPTEVDMAKVEQSRIEKLSKAPTRTWTDRRGRVIADGNFDDFRNNKVYVRTVNGTIRRVPLHTLSDDDRCFVTAWWELPEECNFEGEEYQLRDFRLTTFTWVAAATCHKPLYFEQVGVERYGHSAGPIAQPIISGVHFFGDIVMLPYHAGLTPPKECIYTLGHYRPGDCAPWLLPGFPFSERAFKWEGLALGAAIALLP